MFIRFALFLISYAVWEAVYHIGAFGNAPFFAPPMIFMAIALAAFSTLMTSFPSKKFSAVLLWIFQVLGFLYSGIHLAYIKVFQQPLLLAAAFGGVKDVATNYWRESAAALWAIKWYLLIMAIPLAAGGVLLHKEKLHLGKDRSYQRIPTALTGAVSLLVLAIMLLAGRVGSTGHYDEYAGFYDPGDVFSKYGLLAATVRDAGGDFFEEGVSDEGTMDLNDFQLAITVPGGTEPGSGNGTAAQPSGESINEGTGETPEETENTEETTVKVVDTSPNVLPVDFDALAAMTSDKYVLKAADYMQGMTPTNRNEYTGMFEGYNLIFLSAEGFCTYAIDENLTPTLYRLTHSGFVFNNYYVPLWQTSTSDGEYVNLTALIPDGQFSMRRTADIRMPFALPSYFASEGINSYAFHNNTLSYYERHRSHPNLGYNFMASKLGDVSSEEYGGQIFEMENANYWPASDLDMMHATVPMYVNDERFHVYYMTVSGHMNYNFSGNRMSSKHKADVADLPYCNEGKAYIACNMELDLALEYLLEQLEEAGQLEKTVIVLTADHYPYGMSIEALEELAGKPLDGTLDLYRNSLIIWNSEMEMVEVDKPACSVDVLPTVLNLFGFDYDSRLYAGQDILSDSLGLVIFSNRSFVSDYVSYNKKSGEVTWVEGVEPNEDYLAAIRSRVKGIYDYSKWILNYDFYKYVEQALPEEYRSHLDPAWYTPKGN